MTCSEPLGPSAITAAMTVFVMTTWPTTAENMGRCESGRARKRLVLRRWGIYGTSGWSKPPQWPSHRMVFLLMSRFSHNTSQVAMIQLKRQSGKSAKTYFTWPKFIGTSSHQTAKPSKKVERMKLLKLLLNWKLNSAGKSIRILPFSWVARIAKTLQTRHDRGMRQCGCQTRFLCGQQLCRRSQPS